MCSFLDNTKRSIAALAVCAITLAVMADPMMAGQKGNANRPVIRRVPSRVPKLTAPRRLHLEPEKKNKKYNFNFKGFSNFKVVERGGTYAMFGFHSDSPTKKGVYLSRQPLSVKLSNGKWSITNKSKIEKSTFHILNPIKTNKLVQTSHWALAKNLRPDTTYHVLILPLGANYGKEKTDLFPFTGKFKTRTPKLHVRFKRIEMLDDSDDLSTGEFRFEFFLNGQHAPNGKKLSYVNLDLGSGDNDNKIDLKATVMGTSLTTHVTGWEYDADPTLFGEKFATPGSGKGIVTSIFDNPNAGSGDTSAWEWASSSKNLTSTLQKYFISNASEGVSMAEKEQSSFKFSIYAHGKQINDLRFRVRGTVKVTYE